jgi:hypothetical protein
VGSATGDTTNLRKTAVPGEVFSGSFSGKVPIDPSHRYWSAIHNSPDPLSVGKNVDVYAEITYRNDIPFSVGLAYRSVSGTDYGTTPVVTLTPSEEWNTVFVHLVQQIRGNTTPDPAFHLWFSADGNDSTGTIFLDNIRFIHFK